MRVAITSCTIDANGVFTIKTNFGSVMFKTQIDHNDPSITKLFTGFQKRTEIAHYARRNAFRKISEIAHQAGLRNGQEFSPEDLVGRTMESEWLSPRDQAKLAEEMARL